MKKICVMVVDDSAVVRQSIISVLSQETDIEVITAVDGIFALEKIRHRRPDVIILDLEMPRMHGLEFLNKIMSEDPIPVVVCSAVSGDGTENAFRAIEGGAVEIIVKPRIGVRDYLYEAGVTLIDIVRSAAQSKVKRRVALPKLKAQPLQTADAIIPKAPPPRANTNQAELVVAIGASTGGTEALQVFLQAMPPDCPGIVIVQHMPEYFTKAFAKRLNEICTIAVKEAEQGDEVQIGRALIAPGNHHMMLVRHGARFRVELNDGPLVSRHRPSVDVLFRSAAQNAGKNAIGIIMTGMGKDGALGMQEMKQAGATTFAQDEASCVVFGMPKEAIALNAVDKIVPLPHLATELLRLSLGRNKTINTPPIEAFR